MKFWKRFENIKGLFVFKELGVMMRSLKNVGIFVLSEIDVENIFFFLN